MRKHIISNYANCLQTTVNFAAAAGNKAARSVAFFQKHMQSAYLCTHSFPLLCLRTGRWRRPCLPFVGGIDTPCDALMHVEYLIGAFSSSAYLLVI